MTNRSGTLYTGVTNSLERRVWEHKEKLVTGFTKRYDMTRLVYYETTTDVHAAIAREKQIKGWLRKRKIALIESVNPRWKDLSEGWYEEGQTLRFACLPAGRLRVKARPLRMAGSGPRYNPAGCGTEDQRPLLRR